MHNSSPTLNGGFWTHWKHDLPAGVVVFLVALPLCVGIALASNAPLISGVISGVIAGLVVSVLSGSPLSVSGPAAGLTVIVASQITSLGGFPQFLTAVVLAGVLQIVFGLLRAGILGSVFPNGVIKGMLAAIGIIIILKQIPHAVGWDRDFEGDLSFVQATDQENTFTEIFRAFQHLSTGAVLISLVCLGLLFLWETKAWKRLFIAKIPGPLIAVIAGLGMNEAFRKWIPGFALTADQQQLVALPEGSASEILLGLSGPDLSILMTGEVWLAAVSLAVIASLETLLSVEAVDRLDPYRRTSDSNRELLAQGVGNVLAGFLGGLPMTAVIVRSSANVYSGGRTRLSNIMHGFLLLTAVFALASVLNRVPLAALAAILILVGYKLARISLFKEVYAKGLDQFVPFIVTVIAVIFTDLLTGVMIGFGVGLVIVVRSNYYSSIRMYSAGDYILVRLSKDVTFINKIALREILLKIKPGSKVVIDGTHATVIDRDILEVISDFENSAGHQNIEVKLRNLEHREVPPLFTRKGQTQIETEQ